MSSIWDFTATWLTSTWLFIFINLTILTLFLASHFGSHKKPQQQPLARAPSLLERVRSFDLSFYKQFEQPNTAPATEFLQPDQCDHANPDNPQTQLVRSPSLLDRLKCLNLPTLYRSDSSVPEVEPEPENEAPDSSVNTDAGPGQDHGSVVRRTKSDKAVGAAERPREKMKKSASERSALEENDVVIRRRETSALGDDEEVDAKADDFINRFKQQLRLQRLDSLLRYREFLKGGN
jgi:hypothetical protein